MAFFFQSRRLRAVAVTLASMIGWLAAPRAEAASGTNEYESKAVMLFNLARFVDWPASAFSSSNSPIVIGVLGRNPFGTALVNAVHAEKVNRRRIVVEYYARPQVLKPCHILFICSNEKSRLAAIFAKLKGLPVLSVSEIEGFSAIPGGMVRFYTNEQKKIRIRLNLQTTRSAGLNVSSKLIQVADLEPAPLLLPRLRQTPRFPVGAGLTFPPSPTPAR